MDHPVVPPLRPLQELYGARQPLDQPKHDEREDAEKVDDLVEPEVRVVGDESLELHFVVGLIPWQGLQDSLGRCIWVQDAPIPAVPRVHPYLLIISTFVEKASSKLSSYYKVVQLNLTPELYSLFDRFPSIFRITYLKQHI